jgi:Alpha-amylase/alpha-mannosidase
MTIDLKPGGSIHFGLLLHNHQPVGNFPWVFQQVYEDSYLPLLQALERHPRIRISLHYTGSLLDWLEEAHPDFIQRIAQLVQRKQVEIVGGGYYEPILPSIPNDDRIIQIRRLSEHIEKDFGTRPTGMWIAERVWEPELPGPIAEAGIEWTILDDIHFKNIGMDDQDLLGYYATEDQNRLVKVYATSKDLRYTIPWRPVEETIDLMRSLATPDGERILVMGDDGEKFGSWPDTNAYCWGHDGRSGWVDQFFSALEANSDWIHLTLLGEYASQHAALGRVYLPTSSYLEMTEWALPPQKAYLFGQLRHQLEQEKQDNLLQFMRGGFWRNFLVRYPEINNQHKKMLRVHANVHEQGATNKVGLTHLLKAQANDTYWHGLFGGIYMGHVRSAIYHHLIKAENAADRAHYGDQPWQTYTQTDFDCDTRKELLIESDQQNLYFAPYAGGSLFEWDLRRSAHNALCVMTRHQESYHRTLRDYEAARRHQEANGNAQQQNEPANPHTTVRTKEAGLDRYLVFDTYQRSSLIDHFLPSGLPLESYASNHYDELGDFVNQPYAETVTQDGTGITITFTREGKVKRAGALGTLPVRLTKSVFVPLGAEELVIRYHITNLGQSRLQTNIGSEWNLHLLGGGANPQAYFVPEAFEQDTIVRPRYAFDSTGETLNTQGLHIGNTWLEQNLDFTYDQLATLWRYSIDTVTGSEAGFERTHQGCSVTLLWSLVIEPQQDWNVEVVVKGSSQPDGNF